MPNSKLNRCKICGYDYLDFLPWGIDGKSPTFEICSCCGVEFGYQDCNEIAISRFRFKWINSEKFKSDVFYQIQLDNFERENP